MTLRKHVALVGMPGSGKSTIARMLGKRVAVPVYDTDYEITQATGQSVATLFADAGEGGFRDIEEQQISRICQKAPGLIATGGGAVLREANRVNLRQHCTVVYLRSTPELLSRRLATDESRPLLQGVDRAAKLRDLFKLRDPLYRATAHFVIEANLPTPAQLSHVVLMQLELAGLVGLHAPAPGTV
jgi:shikimate kinase